MRSRIENSIIPHRILSLRCAAALLLAWSVPGFCQLKPATFGRGGANTIGTFRQGSNTTWNLDTNGDHAWGTGDTVAWFGATGDYPIMGDWGNGILQMGIFRGSAGYWVVDSSNNGQYDATDQVYAFGVPNNTYFPGSHDIPVVGDWDHSGRLRIGVFRVYQPGGLGYWIVNNASCVSGTACNFHGTQNVDWYQFQFGGDGDIPVVGDWDNTGFLRIGVYRPGQGWIVNMITPSTCQYQNPQVNPSGLPYTVFCNQYGLQPGIPALPVPYPGLSASGTAQPVLGDWTGTGSGNPHIGLFTPSGGLSNWNVDLTTQETWGGSFIGDTVFPGFGSSTDMPVVGPWHLFPLSGGTSTYQLTTAAGPGGTITPASGLYGSVVKITAVPNSGYQFSGFSGSLSGTTNPQYLTMDGAKSVTATFAQASQLTITTNSPLPAGTLSTAYDTTIFPGFTATSGTPPYTWSVASGSLPSGLSLMPNGTLTTLSGTLRLAGTFSFTIRVSDSASHSATKAFSLAVQVPSLLTSLLALQDCIGASPQGKAMGYGSTCQLAPNPNIADPCYPAYCVTTTLTISRRDLDANNNVIPLVITGLTGGNTTLRRGSVSLPSIMKATSSAITLVTIESLTFDGNRYGFGLQGQGISCQNSPLQPFTAAEAPTLKLTYASYSMIDLDLELGGIFTVAWDDFINSPDTALYLAGNSVGPGYPASTLSTSYFGNGGTGIGPALGGAVYPESGPETATRFTAARIDGNYSGAYYNSFANAGTAAIDLQGTNQYVYGNLLVGNRYEISDGSGGSQLDLDTGTSTSMNASVAGNVIDGINASYPVGPWPPADPYTPCYGGTYCYRYATGCLIVPPFDTNLGRRIVPEQQTNAGVEVFGVGHSLFNNEIAEHSGGGIAVGGVQTTTTCTAPSRLLTISSLNPFDASDTPRYIEGNQATGVTLLGFNQGWKCRIEGVVFDDILVRNNAIAGVYLDSVQGTNDIGSLGLPFQGFFNNACMSGNQTDKDILIRGPNPTTLQYPVPVGAIVSSTGEDTSYQDVPTNTSYRGGPCPNTAWPPPKTPAPSHIPSWPW